MPRLGELEEDIRRAFHGHCEMDIRVKEEIGVMLPSSFDGRDLDELSFEEQVHALQSIVSGKIGTVRRLKVKKDLIEKRQILGLLFMMKS